MADCSAVIATPNGLGYLKKLCIHFAQKVEANWQDHSGYVQFAMGRCELRATDGQLAVSCRADNDQDLQLVADTVKSHFDRFAVRDELVLNWL